MIYDLEYCEQCGSYATRHTHGDENNGYVLYGNNACAKIVEEQEDRYDVVA